jgi:hypothetical protein
VVLHRCLTVSGLCVVMWVVVGGGTCTVIPITMHGQPHVRFINVTLARPTCKLPDDGRTPKHIGAALI